jgi:threonine dehydrogenase-like Zn-dependent dehydrogenase
MFLVKRTPHNGVLFILLETTHISARTHHSILWTKNWEIIGQFVYPTDAHQRLFDLVRSGLFDSSPIRPRVFPLTSQLSHKRKVTHFTYSASP